MESTQPKDGGPRAAGGFARLGVVGLGQMGQFMAAHLASSTQLAPGAQVLGFDRAPVPLTPALARAEAAGRFARASLADVAGAELVLLFPPIAQIEACCRALGPHLRPGTVVLEGCSVMVRPVAAMTALLPSSVELVGCHPLFGPQSGAAGIAGFKVVLSAVRTGRLADVARVFQSLALEIVEMTPEAHDQAMARTQALEQVIGRTLRRMEVRPEAIDVPGYRKLVELNDMLAADSDELFLALQRSNPFAAAVTARFQHTLAAVLAEANQPEVAP